MTAAASEVEPEPPEIRQKFVLNHLTQMIESWRSALEFASGTFEIAGTKHIDALPHASDGRFHGTASGEGLAQFIDRSPHVSVGIALQLTRQLRDTRQYRIHVTQLVVHRRVIGFVPCGGPGKRDLNCVGLRIQGGVPGRARHA